MRVFIAGISSQIGLETARIFDQNGWEVLGQYNSHIMKVTNFLENLSTKNKNIEHYYKCDLSHCDKVQKLSESLSSINIDSFIYNAGTYWVQKHFTEISATEVENCFRVNFLSALLLERAILPGMSQRKFGRVVNVSSIAAKYGGGSQSLHYGASKLALEGLTKTLAREEAPSNVLVNTVRPGVIDTDFHQRFPKDLIKRAEMIPVKKIGKPDDIARVLYYLGSDKNQFMTGETLTIAGGE